MLKCHFFAAIVYGGSFSVESEQNILNASAAAVAVVIQKRVHSNKTGTEFISMKKKTILLL